MTTAHPKSTTETTPAPERVRLTTTIDVAGQTVRRGTIGTVALRWGADAVGVAFPGCYGVPTVPRRLLAAVPEEPRTPGTIVELRDDGGRPRRGIIRRVYGHGPSARVTVAHEDGTVGRYPLRALLAVPSRPMPAPISVYLTPARYQAFAAECDLRGLSMSAVAVTWLLTTAAAAGRQVGAHEYPGPERLAQRRSIGHARAHRASTRRHTLSVYLYGQEREHLAALAARQHRSDSNVLETCIAAGLAGDLPWPVVTTTR